ncbi:unnamed protein product [Colias eurytheme]|nr:unnamed protein product [Colias eurytheme]
MAKELRGGDRKTFTFASRKEAFEKFIQSFTPFDLLENTINQLNLRDKPSSIWNLDGTSFCKDPSKTKVVVVKGHAATRVISSPGRDNTTVLLCANALGEKAPPLIVFKGKQVWDEWTIDKGFEGMRYAATANGWMESTVFENYLKKQFRRETSYIAYL